MTAGYNRGDRYEELVYKICVNHQITPKNFRRGGAGNSSDIEFIHKGKKYVLEVKADTKADYGQKMLKWERGIWKWCVDDESTRMYTSLGLLKHVQDKKFIPKRYAIKKELLTTTDRNSDQRNFEESMVINTDKLFLYYKQKDCHYIQIGGYGFYYLDKDILKLGVPRFNGKLNIRFRAKTIHSHPIWNYGFYAVLKVAKAPKESRFDMEPKTNKIFPPIIP